MFGVCPQTDCTPRRVACNNAHPRSSFVGARTRKWQRSPALPGLTERPTSRRVQGARACGCADSAPWGRGGGTGLPSCPRYVGGGVGSRSSCFFLGVPKPEG